MSVILCIIEAARAATPGPVITRPLPSTWAERSAECISCRRLAINQPFEGGKTGVGEHGGGGLP